MNIAELLARDSVQLSVKAASYHEALEQMAIHLSYLSELRPQQILSALLERESRGSTALGGGVALPHARIEGLRRPYGAFFRFAAPLAADTPDGQPLAIAFVIISPEGANATYLRSVGKMAAVLKSLQKRIQLTDSEDKDIIFATLTSEDS